MKHASRAVQNFLLRVKIGGFFGKNRIARIRRSNLIDQDSIDSCSIIVAK